MRVDSIRQSTKALSVFSRAVYFGYTRVTNGHMVVAKRLRSFLGSGRFLSSGHRQTSFDLSDLDDQDPRLSCGTLVAVIVTQLQYV